MSDWPRTIATYKLHHTVETVLELPAHDSQWRIIGVSAGGSWGSDPGAAVLLHVEEEDSAKGRRAVKFRVLAEGDAVPLGYEHASMLVPPLPGMKPRFVYARFGGGKE